jgi:uncharacterized membrane protein YeaQ/YmgE (transglycosylase-associated protein family)
MLSLIGQILFGLVVGVIAKLLMPGRDPGGIVVTALIGMLGALIGSLIGRALWGGPGYNAGWITSILGAMLLLWGYRMIAGRTGGRVRPV